MEIIEPQDPLQVDIPTGLTCTLASVRGRPKAEETVHFCAPPQSIVSKMLCQIKESDTETIDLCEIETLPEHVSDVEDIAVCQQSVVVHRTLLSMPDRKPQKIILKRQHVCDHELTIAEEDEIRINTLKNLKLEAEEKNPNEKLYKCDHADCSYRSNLMCNLSKHKRIHTDQKPYLCDQCPFRTNFVNSLKVHRRIHTTERPYCCDECGYKCNTISNLKKHKHHKHSVPTT